MECTKMEINVSTESWLSGHLRDWAKSLLSESEKNTLTLRQFNKNGEEHMSVKRNWSDCLMFHAFRSEQ